MNKEQLEQLVFEKITTHFETGEEEIGKTVGFAEIIPKSLGSLSSFSAAGSLMDTIQALREQDIYVVVFSNKKLHVLLTGDAMSFMLGKVKETQYFSISYSDITEVVFKKQFLGGSKVIIKTIDNEDLIFNIHGMITKSAGWVFDKSTEERLRSMVKVYEENIDFKLQNKNS